MKENFKPALYKVLKHEGGFSHYPMDKGGPTNLGVTLATLRNFYADYDYGDLDGDGDIDINDIRLLDTMEKAAPVYKKYFWDRMKLDAFPSGIDFLMFDFGVNSGPQNAFKLLQRALNQANSVALVVDGIIGKKTREEVKRADIWALIKALLNERDVFYRKIIARDHSQEKFLNGWLNRVAKLAVDVRTFL